MMDGLSKRFDGLFEFSRILRNEADELVALCTSVASNKPAVVHRLKNVSKNVRIHIEFETSQCKACQHLPSLIDYSFDDGVIFLVVDAAPGLPLSQLELGRIPAPKVVSIAISLFRCLRELHDLGIEHLDVCPSNLVVDPGDFSSKLVRSSYLPKSHDRVSLESALCSSPEQAGSIDRDVTAASDLYSAGILIYLMLFGKYPFPGESVGEVLLAHMTQPIPSAGLRNESVPRVLSEIVERLLQKDPTDRYQTAEAVLHDLGLLADAMEQGVNSPSFSLGLRDRRASIVEPALVGRTRELDEFRNALKRPRKDGSSLTFLEGVSGAGKTRTLVEFARCAVEDDWLVLRGQCIQEASRKSLAAMQGIVQGFESRIRDPAFAEQFHENFDGEWSDLQSHFPGIGSHSQESADTTLRMAPNEQRSLRTLTSFINALGSQQQPAMLILDDCQWADDLTLKMLDHWWKDTRSSFHRVTIVAVFRSDEVSETHGLRKLSPSSHIRLSRLTDEDIRQIAESMAGTLPNRALDFIVTVAGGSPFMASAAVRGLVESKAIIHSVDGWTINDDEFEVCQSSNHAAEFLARRLELLDVATIQLLSAAAVLGREFDLDAAAQLANCAANDAFARISDARNRNLLWYRTRGNRYVFSHDKIREALQGLLSKSALMRMHRSAAEYLVSLGNSNDASVAFHYDAAGALDLALPYAIRAASEASKTCNLSTAKTQFQIAKRGSQFASQEQRCAIETGLGNVLMQRGEYDSAERHFQCAVSFARTVIENAQASGNIAELQRRRGDIGGAIKSFERSLRILGYTLPKSRLLRLALLWKESVVQLMHTTFPQWFLGRLKRSLDDREVLALTLFRGLTHSYYNGSSGLNCLHLHLKSLNLAERYGESNTLALHYLEHVGGISLVGMIRRAVSYAEKAHRMMAEEFPALRDGLRGHYLSVGYFCTARYDKSIELGRTAIEKLERLGDFWKIHMTRYQIAASLYSKGYYREAIDEAKKNYESGIDKGDFQASGIILDVWARAQPGDVPEDILQTEFDRKRDDAQGTCHLLIAKTANLVGLGRYDEAIAAAHEGIRLALRTGLSTPYPYAIIAWGITAYRKKAETLGPLQVRCRKATLRSAIKLGGLGLVHACIQSIELPRLMREIGLVLAMQGRPRIACLFLHASIRIAQRQRAEFDGAESLRVLAAIGEEHGWPDAKSQFADANAHLSKLEIEHGVARIRRRVLEEEDATLSLVDRFDAIIDAGRKIAAALRDEDIYQAMYDTATRLLRCDVCILQLKDGKRKSVVGNHLAHFREAVIAQVIHDGQAVSELLEEAELVGGEGKGSLLCAPVFVLGEVKALIYATHVQVRNMFGDDEIRLSQFIATIAGASLESAQGYHQLQELNVTLEDRVAERTLAAETRAKELVQANHELKETQRKLTVAVAEANEANQSKSRFLATMSHEIRTPMNGILGMAELALASDLKPSQQKYIKVVKESGQTLLGLLNEVLDLSKIEAGKMEFEEIEFELRDVVEGAVQLLSPAGHQKDLDIICEIDVDVPVLVRGDPNRLRQVIVNLLGNAIKFTNHGQVLVYVRNRDDGAVQFDVSDSGIGISSEKRGLIFEAFQQEDSSTTRRYGGTGLGLSICQQLSKLMGGDIEVDSTLGEGSTFSFWIPFRTKQGAQIELATESLCGRMTALVCPKPSLTRSTQKMLECLGLHVIDMPSLADLEDDMIGDFDLLIVDEPSESDLLTMTGKESVEKSPRWIVMDKPGGVEGELPLLTKPLSMKEVQHVLSVALVGENLGSGVVTKSVQKVGTSKWRVLLADDCDVNQEVACGLLELEGFEVETVENGEMALEKIRREHFDVVLMDLEMPVMDGVETTREIRKDNDIPVIALSAHPVIELQARCGDVGFDDYLSKPFDPALLVATINKQLSKQAGEKPEEFTATV